MWFQIESRTDTLIGGPFPVNKHVDTLCRSLKENYGVTTLLDPNGIEIVSHIAVIQRSDGSRYVAGGSLDDPPDEQAGIGRCDLKSI